MLQQAPERRGLFVCSLRIKEPVMAIEDIDWKRVARHTRKIAKYHDRCEHHGEVFTQLVQILGECQPFSQSRRMANRVFSALCQPEPIVLVPICVDYSTLKIRSVLEGHRAFLEKLICINKNISPVLLVPDQEAYDEVFVSALNSSVDKIEREHLEGHGKCFLCG